MKVAIVGAGPAGAVAAKTLARGGADVTLFDGSHPREKPCGGGVTGRALALVGDALAGRGVPGVPITAAVFADTGGTHDRERTARVALDAQGFSKASSLVVVSRAVFDRALLDAALEAGARLVPSRVTAVDVQPDGVDVRTRDASHRADVVIGADGANSLVRRTVAQAFTRAELSIATGYYAHGVSSSVIDIRFSSRPAGYLWSFPRPDHLAIGICAQADASQPEPLKEACRAWMDEARLAPGAELTPYSWPIPSLGPAAIQREQPAGRGWLLAGDAAGLVDPITREGIFFALQSGLYAAESLIESPSAYAPAYTARLRADIYPELAHAARLKAGFFRGRFTRLLIEALHRSAPVRAIMADLVGGRQANRGLRRRLLRTFELGLAWQLLRLYWQREDTVEASADVLASSGGSSDWR